MFAAVCRCATRSSLPVIHQRAFSLSSFKLHSYQGDGKTTMTLLNQEPDAPLMINSYSHVGFRLNSGLNLLGSIAIFPKSVLSWGVNSAEEITVESLSLFLTLEPKLDVLVIGYGDPGKKVDKKVLQELKSRNINYELLTTDNACTTFNFLNDEKRSVAGAIIPPKNIKFISSDIISTQQRRKQLYKVNLD